MCNINNRRESQQPLPLIALKSQRLVKETQWKARLAPTLNTHSKGESISEYEPKIRGLFRRRLRRRQTETGKSNPVKGWKHRSGDTAWE